MIIDNIKNAKKYYALGNRIKTALEYLEQSDFSKIPAGNYEIDKDLIFARVREYADGGRNPSDCIWEGHKNYLDVHFVADGIERFGYANISDMKEISYNSEKDQVDLEGEGIIFTVKKGFFVLTDKEDIHLPCVKDRELPYLKKVIVKVKT